MPHLWPLFHIPFHLLVHHPHGNCINSHLRYPLRKIQMCLMQCIVEHHPRKTTSFNTKTINFSEHSTFYFQCDTSQFTYHIIPSSLTWISRWCLRAIHICNDTACNKNTTFTHHIAAIQFKTQDLLNLFGMVLFFLLFFRNLFATNEFHFYLYEKSHYF